VRVGDPDRLRSVRVRAGGVEHRAPGEVEVPSGLDVSVILLMSTGKEKT